MSTNCIRCIKNKRTGSDLLCDACRSVASLKRADHLANWTEFGKSPEKLRQWAGMIGDRPELRLGYCMHVLKSAADQMEKLEQDIKAMAPHPKLKDQFPVVLYFSTKAERDEFAAYVLQEKPELLEVKL